MAWTDEMVEELKKMWSEGLTTNEIAKNLGVSKNSIVGKVHRLNLTARPSPIKKKDEDTDVENLPDKKNKASVKSVRITINSFEMSDGCGRQDVTKIRNGCVKLTDLDNHTCRWPMGDPRDDNFCFCGKKVRSGQTYCEEHSAIAYVKPTKKV